MSHYTISELKQNTGENPTTATVDTQLQKRVTKTTKSGKPYLQITLTDAIDQFSLKIWENLPQFATIQSIELDAFIRLEGDWIQNQYGIDASRWQFRLLNEGEIQNFLIGDPETSKIQTRDWNDIVKLTTSISDPRLNQLCAMFLDQHGEKFRRTAAARKNHHARRGGMLEHVAQMMRSAVALSSVYPELNLDLLIAGVLFHDSGKLWENSYPERGFTQPYDMQGEMLGHIPLGISLVDKLWDQMISSCVETTDTWGKLTPTNDEVRIHLLHLVASHHGTYEFGSPTLPRTPEAQILHHIDNIDAKFEMMKQAYQTAPELAPGIQEKQFPLPANLIKPLAHINPEMAKANVVIDRTNNDKENTNNLDLF
ncbi:MAG: HD domain-containing protein [Rubritalea sp.]|tara:strand:+ start:4440 stop:5546 length:1107 start_codon:yes stop_codon:yes gene_type:complete